MATVPVTHSGADFISLWMSILVFILCASCSTQDFEVAQEANSNIQSVRCFSFILLLFQWLYLRNKMLRLYCVKVMLS